MKKSTDKTKYVNCPNCQNKAVWSPENKHRPFCSERCKLIDLGEWATGSYAIAQTHSEEDEVFSSMLETSETQY